MKMDKEITRAAKNEANAVTRILKKSQKTDAIVEAKHKESVTLNNIIKVNIFNKKIYEKDEVAD